MSRDEILAALAVIALAGVIVYVFNQSQNTSPAMTEQGLPAQVDLDAADTTSADSYNMGPAIYISQTPYLFQVPLGNIVPNLSSQSTGQANNVTVAANRQCLGCLQ